MTLASELGGGQKREGEQKARETERKWLLKTKREGAICHYGGRTIVTQKIEMYLMNLLDMAKEILKQQNKNTKQCF